MTPAPAVSPRLQQFTDGLPWERGPLLAFAQEVAAALPAGARLLDVGAGDSPYRELFGHVAYASTDWANSVHPGARQVDVVAPAHDLGLPDASYDAVLLTQVLEHVPNPAEVLAELHRVLVPGGTLYMTVPLAWELHELPFDFYRYTPWGLDHLLTQAGFGQRDIAPRNDCFGTLAQLMADIASTMGTYPDGRDGERAQAAAVLRQMAPTVASFGGLDARRVLPLGYQVIATKDPAGGAPVRARHQTIADARAFVTVAFADEVLFDPALLAAYAARFDGNDDCSLVIYAPGAEQGELLERLGRLVTALGLDGEDAADLLVLPEAPEGGERALAAGADAVLARRPPRGAFAAVPHVHDGALDALRALMSPAFTPAG